jgi:hypothetical protein
MYVFFYKNNFLMVMHGLWTKYNHDILQKKNRIEQKKILLAETTHQLHANTKRYHLFIQQTNIVAKKYFESIAINKNIDPQINYDIYCNNVKNKIEITKERELQIDYTEKLLISYVQEYNDFEFIEKLEHIRRGDA